MGYSPWGHKESDMTEHACTPPPVLEIRKLRLSHVERRQGLNLGLGKVGEMECKRE